MSGGYYGYAYTPVNDMADRLEQNLLDETLEPNDPRRHPTRALFAKHLRRVADRMRIVEWVDSGDMSPPWDIDAINELFDTKKGE